MLIQNGHQWMMIMVLMIVAQLLKKKLWNEAWGGGNIFLVMRVKGFFFFFLPIYNSLYLGWCGRWKCKRQFGEVWGFLGMKMCCRTIDQYKIGKRNRDLYELLWLHPYERKSKKSVARETWVIDCECQHKHSLSRRQQWGKQQRKH